MEGELNINAFGAASKSVDRYEKMFQPGRIIIADLTDPMMGAQDACAIFSVLIENFRKKRMPCGKIVVADEAHRYFSQEASNPLSHTIIDGVRLMRHEGCRYIIASQSPLSIPREIVELTAVALCHNFQSPAWFSHLKGALGLS